MAELVNSAQLSVCLFSTHYLLHASPVIHHIAGEVKPGRDFLGAPLQRCQLLGMDVDSATGRLRPPSDADPLEFPQPVHGQACEGR